MVLRPVPDSSLCSTSLRSDIQAKTARHQSRVPQGGQGRTICSPARLRQDTLQRPTACRRGGPPALSTEPVEATQRNSVRCRFTCRPLDWVEQGGAPLRDPRRSD